MVAMPAFAQNPADLEKLTVLEDRAKPGGRKIELAFARLKSTGSNPGSPIVYLDGGPGGSGIGMYRVDDYKVMFDEMRAAGDVILLSQRGTGFSTPRLIVPRRLTDSNRSVRERRAHGRGARAAVDSLRQRAAREGHRSRRLQHRGERGRPRGSAKGARRSEDQPVRVQLRHSPRARRHPAASGEHRSGDPRRHRRSRSLAEVSTHL